MHMKNIIFLLIHFKGLKKPITISVKNKKRLILLG